LAVELPVHIVLDAAWADDAKTLIPATASTAMARYRATPGTGRLEREQNETST
jgi:hypothetical protein